MGHPVPLELAVMVSALGLCSGGGGGDLVGPRTVWESEGQEQEEWVLDGDR